jgi:hypothetical protein
MSCEPDHEHAADQQRIVVHNQGVRDRQPAQCGPRQALTQRVPARAIPTRQMHNRFSPRLLEPATHIELALNKTRGQRAQRQPTPAGTGIPARSPSAPEARQGWAALVKQVYAADPICCPNLELTSAFRGWWATATSPERPRRHLAGDNSASFRLEWLHLVRHTPATSKKQRPIS